MWRTILMSFTQCYKVLQFQIKICLLLQFFRIKLHPLRFYNFTRSTIPSPCKLFDVPSLTTREKQLTIPFIISQDYNYNTIISSRQHTKTNMQHRTLKTSTIKDGNLQSNFMHFQGYDNATLHLGVNYKRKHRRLLEIS